jgi:hypothetical protein
LALWGICAACRPLRASSPRESRNPRETRDLRGFARVFEREAPVGVEPTMADLQSAALATWLRSRLCWSPGCSRNHLRYGNLGDLVKVFRPPRPQRFCLGQGSSRSCLSIGCPRGVPSIDSFFVENGGCLAPGRRRRYSRRLQIDPRRPRAGCGPPERGVLATWRRARHPRAPAISA